VKPSYQQKFSNAEFRFGMGVQYKLFRFLDLKSRFALGYRLKREKTDPNPSYKTIPPPFYLLDEITGKNNYFFYEIPVVAQFNILQHHVGTIGIGLRAGASFRHFIPIDHHGPPYNSNDVGLLTGVQVGITKNISIGADYYFGLLHATLVSYTSGSDSDTMEAWNRFGMITLDYRWKK
jgi:hypothetical protein